jgi:hypothetical protein
MPMRPQAERRLREGFQQRVDEQGSRYAARLAHARQQAARFECGEVAGVFSARAGGEVLPATYVVALLPLAAIPVLIAAAALGIAGHAAAARGVPVRRGCLDRRELLAGAPAQAAGLALRLHRRVHAAG